MLDKNEILKGSKDAVRQMAGAATAYEEANPEEINSQAYQKGYADGVKYMYYNIMQKLYEGVSSERIIGVVNGKLEVEKLDSDSEDFYKGYYDGVYNAYECYELQTEHNCPYIELGSCDRAKPCYGCEQCLDDLEEPSTDYFLGYEAGYDKGLLLWYDTQYPTKQPMTLDEFSKQEELWNNVGEPMTQEELDELHCVEEDDSYLDELSFIQGKKIGFDSGYEVGYAEATDDIEKYNVVLDCEFLDQIQEFKEQILSYCKEYDNGKNKDHNFMLYDLHHSLICLTEAWVMDQVWKYWDKNKEE